MNHYREMLAKAVMENGGYSHNLQGSYPLAWDVSVVPDKTTFEELFDLAMARFKEDSGVEQAAWTPEALIQVKRDWNHGMNHGELYNWVVEDMRYMVTESDTYKCMRPELLVRYGLSADPLVSRTYEPNPWRKVIDYGREYDVEFSFAGRGGKHLVIDHFEGVKLRGLSSKELALRIQDDQDDEAGSYGNLWCQKLLAMIHEWDLCFTSENVESAWEDTASYLLSQRLLVIHEQGDAGHLGIEGIDDPYTVSAGGVALDSHRIPGLVTISGRLPTEKALLLGRIIKDAIETHLDVHG